MPINPPLPDRKEGVVCMFASEWEEELVCEWLSLQGYFVEVNVPLTTGEGGGRKEADIIAVRVDENRLIIKHVEIGSLAESFQRNVERVTQKFDEDRVKAVVNYVRSRFSKALEVDYRKIYIATFCGRPADLRRELGERGVEFLLLRELVEKEIPESIEKWKKDQQDAGLVRRWKEAMLPRSYWLLKMIELMKDMSPFYTRFPANEVG
jgi:hypothetical protein